MLFKFDTAVEEYHRALQEKNYVVAAKQHGTVSSTFNNKFTLPVCEFNNLFNYKPNLSE